MFHFYDGWTSLGLCIGFAIWETVWVSLRKGAAYDANVQKFFFLCLQLIGTAGVVFYGLAAIVKAVLWFVAGVSGK